MTYKEENIVYIAMKAGELLKEGKIDSSEHGGHMALTTDIVWMAGEFERRHANVNWDESDLDYWEEIDNFAEAGLTEVFGVEQSHDAKQLDIKVVIEEGVVHAVLKNENLPVTVEVVDVDPDYEDYQQLDAYKKQLYKDPSFTDCDYTVAHFDLESELEDPVHDISGDEIPLTIQQPVQVVAVSGNTEGAVLFSGTWDACEQFCKDNGWSYFDESCFRWDMEIQDPLELTLPEGFYLAVDHYSDALGVDIHNGFVRQHAEELVFCHKNDIDFGDFDFWTRYETLLGEKLSFGDYSAIERHFHGDPNDIELNDKESIQKIRGYLEGSRSERKAVLSLDEQILKADDKRLSQQPLPGKEFENQR